MKINSFFNQKVSQVYLLNLLYIFSSPLAKYFIKLNIKPNTITTFSNISALLSFISLFYNFYLFAFFWILALILDICDGIVARATQVSNSHGSFYDHFSDNLKIIFLFLMLYCFYNNEMIQFLIIINLILFSTVDYLDGVMGKKLMILKYNPPKINNYTPNYFMKNIQKLNTYLNKLSLYKAFFLMHGQYNLILILIAINEATAIYFIILSCFICLWTVLILLSQVVRLNQIMMINNIPWK